MEIPTNECLSLSQIRHGWLANTVRYLSPLDWRNANDAERASFLQQATGRLAQLGSVLSQEPDVFDPARILDFLRSDGAQTAALREALRDRPRTPRWVLKLLHRCECRRSICLGRLERLRGTTQDERTYAQFQASCRRLHDALDQLPRGPALP